MNGKFYQGIQYINPAAEQLFKSTNKNEFLHMAQRIGDNILIDRFHNGFFVVSDKHTYTKFDAIDSLALLRLHAAIAGCTQRVPKAWPGT